MEHLDQDTYVSAQEIGARLGLDEDFLLSRAKAGKIPCVRLSAGVILFRMRAVITALETPEGHGSPSAVAAVRPRDLTREGAITYRKRDVATVIGVSVRTLERLAAANKFPAPDARIGRAPLWFPDTISKWLAAGGGRI